MVQYVTKQICTSRNLPINIDDFKEVEEKLVKERVKKQRQKRRDVAEKNKLLRKKQKQEQDKVKEKQMWERLSELNKEFSDIRQSKKNSKRMSESIIKM